MIFLPKSSNIRLKTYQIFAVGFARFKKNVSLHQEIERPGGSMENIKKDNHLI